MLTKITNNKTEYFQQYAVIKVMECGRVYLQDNELLKGREGDIHNRARQSKWLLGQKGDSCCRQLDNMRAGQRLRMFHNLKFMIFGFCFVCFHFNQS